MTQQFGQQDELLFPSQSADLVIICRSEDVEMASNLLKFGFLPAKQSVFLLCDVQEKFRPLISHFEEIVQSASRLVSKSSYLNSPFELKVVLFVFISDKSLQNLKRPSDRDRAVSKRLGSYRSRN